MSGSTEDYRKGEDTVMKRRRRGERKGNGGFGQSYGEFGNPLTLNVNGEERERMT